MKSESKLILIIYASILFILPACKHEFVLNKQDYKLSESIILIDTIDIQNPAVISYKKKGGVLGYCISLDDFDENNMFKYLDGERLIPEIDACCKFHDPYMRGQYDINEYEDKPSYFVIAKVKKEFYLDEKSGMHNNLRKSFKNREKWLMVAIPFCGCK
ncbi:hypothetical protein [Chondrinema litorale]|uniref:hypothetical protein n=1 Tax=Chondrinema litorale TaxID=2994555 RepID=UPI002543C59F|nr:hypothetical protein [Chondrinema litorale]UZR97511.1 hypothetical protein OQ292_27270 [Chondrinema litorale]